MGAQKRVIIGSESDDSLKLELDELTDGKVAIPVTIFDDSGDQINLASGLIQEKYDHISLGYTGSDLTTVIYKTGGSSGTTVATLTLTYLAGVLKTITKT
jgi:hypothetical protein